MRQRNHCSSLKGTPKMKLQGSGPSAPKSLQSQNRPRPENRLSISRLDVVHGQRCKLASTELAPATSGQGSQRFRALASSGRDGACARAACRFEPTENSPWHEDDEENEED